jgi:hypothetical protein
MNQRQFQQRFFIAPFTAGERDYLEKVIADAGGKRPFHVKQCWKNAQELICHDGEGRLRYCEGFLDDTIPHAWVTIAGKVFDVTAEAVDRRLKRGAVCVGILVGSLS